MAAIAPHRSTIEKIAVEIRHLQKSENQGGGRALHERAESSSASRTNEIRLALKKHETGCARVLRGYMLTAFENIPLWHERDISHSSAERIILPDATILLDYMLDRFAKIVDNLVVFEEKHEG